MQQDYILTTLDKNFSQNDVTCYAECIELEISVCDDLSVQTLPVPTPHLYTQERARKAAIEDSALGVFIVRPRGRV